MKAMVLNKICNLENNSTPLELLDVPTPVPKNNEILVKITSCGVCHTELDEIEGRTPPSRFPVILGHQIIGRVVETGRNTGRFNLGERVGIAWINSSCRKCPFCINGKENLCDDFKATGRDENGGYAEYATVNENFAYTIPEKFTDSEAAPLLCAGAIGFRSLKLSGIKNGDTIGLVGFGASAHLVIKMITYQYPETRVFVFSRTEREREFAIELGAFWAGDISDDPPEKLHAAIDTTPAWMPVVVTMKNLEKGGRLVINAIRKEGRDKDALLKIDYSHYLWMEKEIKSVANITRADVNDFLQLAANIPIRPEVQEFQLEEANVALLELKERKIRGAKVLKVTA